MTESPKTTRSLSLMWILYTQGSALEPQGLVQLERCWVYSRRLKDKSMMYSRDLFLRVLGLGLIALAAEPSIAADASKLPGGTWATIAQLPDLNGVWEMTFGGRGGGLGAPQQVSLTPKYAAML